MNLDERLEALVGLGKYIISDDLALARAKSKAHQKNGWFTRDNINKSLQAIATNYLNPDSLQQWINHYQLPQTTQPKKVGIIMAGNIPAVGFQDFLCCFAAGHIAKIKLSEKDAELQKAMVLYLYENYPKSKELIQIVSRLNDIEAIIATGSNNTSRYFEAYFGKYPNIIRKNRNSVGVIKGDETHEELVKLGEDIFSYFGLGCRNVSKLYLPKDYNFHPLLEALHEYREIVMHHKYKNNFDYNYTLIILNKIAYEANGCILMTENKSIASKIASLHYEFYEDKNWLVNELTTKKEEIQCIVTNTSLPSVKTFKFGEAQHPTLFDYPDDIDVVEFLKQL